MNKIKILDPPSLLTVSKRSNIQANMYFVKPNIIFSKKRVRSNAKLRENVLVPPNY